MKISIHKVHFAEWILPERDIHLPVKFIMQT